MYRIAYSFLYYLVTALTLGVNVYKCFLYTDLLIKEMYLFQPRAVSAPATPATFGFSRDQVRFIILLYVFLTRSI